ncbi:hypothetical protein C922_01274 [Plasmodium inui San Antonio 1]|uniref:RSE1/DDB1/CPSF1 C-terminal domain-containing protein n=1 Tax=Plasmodium inui San Antonio 1 TaxID=1237626 RepID=W7A994_9APIC|nr:hypothetical protein C922_01274 [Plasmodium inui San Antonio 1]EUD68255.1 hypothetical protein C922_01274 [Plasmodium inui San Antonio 1]
MINLQVHQLRSPSETDHCECGNLLREKSLEFVLIKNKNLSIYTYQRRRKRNYLIYETKLNAPVVKLVILKGVFLRKNKQRISGVLLVYKGLHFVLYRFNRHLNTLLVVLKHSFVKKAKFQPLFYSLPIAVNYVHRYDKGGGSAAGRTIRIGGRKPVTGITRRRRIRLASKRLKGCIRGLHPGLRQGGGRPEEEVTSKKWNEKGRRGKATPVGHPSEATKWGANSQNGVDDEFYANLSGERGRGANLEEHFWLDRFVPEDIDIWSEKQQDSLQQLSHRNPLRIIPNGQTRTNKRNLNFCEFAVSFSNDFKTIYIFFYSSRRRGKNGLDPTCAGEIRTTYFRKDLYLFNIVKVSLQDVYRHFIFIKNIFFHGGNMHVLLQNEPINVGHATVEELSLKLLILRQEEHKFDANKLTKGFPNGTIDLLRVKELLICLCQDYVCILNMRRNQKVIYMFKKSCYTNGVFHLQKGETLFYDCTHFNVHFKESSSNMCHRKGKIFILTRKCILEGTLSRDHNDMVKLLKWRKVHTFKYDLAKSSVWFFQGRVHFVCCYNGICGRADVDLLVRRGGGGKEGSPIKGGFEGGSSRKRKAELEANPGKPAKREKLQKGEKEQKEDKWENHDGVPPSGDVSLDIDVLAPNGDPVTAPLPVVTTRGDPPLTTRRVQPNDNFLMDLLIYLNRNPTINEDTKGLNHSKYDFLFQKYRKKIKILEGNFSLLNAQGGVEYFPSLFLLRGRKKKGREKIGTSIPLGGMTNKEAITLVDKIPSKGMLTDLIKSNEEPSLVNKSSYFALIGNKKHSRVEKILFRVPFSTLLSVSIAGGSARGVCATEGGRGKRSCHYIMINFEGEKPERGDEGATQNKRKDRRSYDKEKTTSQGGGNALIGRRSLLLCVDSLNTWREKKGTITKGTSKKGTLSNEKKERLVDEATTSGLHSSDGGENPRGALLSDHRARVIYTLRGDTQQGEPSHEVEFPPTGTAKVDTFRAFFRFYPFVHYRNRDVRRYLEGFSNGGTDHFLHGGNESEELSRGTSIKRDRKSQTKSKTKSKTKSDGRRTSSQRSHFQIQLKQKYVQFFLTERRKNTHLSMEGKCIALLRFKSLLVQVCRKEINVSLYANTCMVLRNVPLKEAVVECKMVRKFLILRHESGSCSVYAFHVDQVTDLLLRIDQVTSLLNMCLLRCLDMDTGEEEINLLRFATSVREQQQQERKEEDHEDDADLLSLFRTKTPHTFCKVVNRMGGSDVGEILSLYTQLDNVRCISTVKKRSQSFLSFLDDANCTLRIFHLEKRRTLFVSNPLLAVPKYLYNAERKKDAEQAGREKLAQITPEEGELPPAEPLLDTYKLEEVINVLLFPLGPNYVLIVFLTGRPIMIYKNVGQVRSIKRLKFQVVAHRYTQPLLSNVHFVKDPRGEKIEVVTVSRDKAEVNNGFVVYIDGRSRRRKESDNLTLQMREKKKKKKSSKCIVGYPYVDISKVDLSHLSGTQKEQLYQKVRAYNAVFPPLLLSNCRGKLFVHRCGGEGEAAKESRGAAKEAQPRSIVKIDRNAFLRVDATSLRIVTIGEEEKVCPTGPDRDGSRDRDDSRDRSSSRDRSGRSDRSGSRERAGSRDRSGRSDRSDRRDPTHRESQLKRDVGRTLSEACPPLKVTCHHSNVDTVQVHDDVFLVRSPPPNRLSFNDDFISKMFLSYPYVCKIAVSQFEYVLKRGKGRQEGDEKGGQKEGEHEGQKKGEKESEKEGQKKGANKPTATTVDTGEKANQAAAVNQQGNPPVRRGTRGKIICAVVRIKYDEYHCLKKLQKRRLNLQKEELRSNLAYAGEEHMQCVPNVHLQDSINNQYTHKLKGFLCRGSDENGNDNEEEAATRDDEEVMSQNNKLICSAKTNAKFSKLLLLHEGSRKRVYGYYTFEHSEEIHCVSFGCLHGKEYIYVSTSLNIGERVETQGNIYVFDLSGVFARVGEDPIRGGEEEGQEEAKEGKETEKEEKEATEAAADGEHREEEEKDKSSPSGKSKKGKLSLYMKKTYNSPVTQIHPLYIHSEGFLNGRLDTALQSIILSHGGDMKHCGKYSGRSQHGELLSGEEELSYSPNGNIIMSRRAKQKSRKVDPNVHCNILHCINSKIFIHEVNQNDFTKGAFLDNNFFITDIKIVKNFFIVADLYRGIYINMYNYEEQYDSRSIIPIAKPFCSSNLNILCCQYLVLDSLLCILAMDVFNNLLIFSFRSHQSVDTLYLFSIFNFSRRILKYVNAVHPDRRSNSALSISNDGSLHLFHPLRSNSFVFFRETYNIVRMSLFPHLALNAHADLIPDVFTQSARLNLHMKRDSFSIKNVLFDDMLR